MLVKLRMVLSFVKLKLSKGQLPLTRLRTAWTILVSEDGPGLMHHKRAASERTFPAGLVNTWRFRLCCRND